MIFDDKQVVMLELKQPEVLGSFVKKLRNLLESVVFTVSTGTGKPIQIPERYQHRFTSTCTVPVLYRIRYGTVLLRYVCEE